MTLRRKRVLFLTCHLPFPPVSGGRRREHELLRRLCGRFDVEVCAVTKTIEEDRRAVAHIPWPNAGAELFRAEAVAHPAPQVARHGSRAASGWLAQNVSRFDAIHVEGFYLWQHLPPMRPPAVLGEQNIEYHLWEQRGLFEASRATREAERAVWREADALVALTEEDRVVIAGATSRAVELVPDGVDHDSRVSPDRRMPERSATPAIVFVGNFAYEPNVDAALWLAEEIFPAVRERTRAKLQLVGNEPPPEIRALAGADLEVTGRVPTVEPWLDAAAVVACPIRIGGGVKVKVLEALRRGRAVVATPGCTHGIAGAAGAMRVAGTTEAFATSLTEVLTRPDERLRLERQARACAAKLPTWDSSAHALTRCWDRAGVAVTRAA